MILVTYLVVRALVTVFFWFVVALAAVFTVCCLVLLAAAVGVGRWVVKRVR
jgi:hypothetical protein